MSKVLCFGELLLRFSPKTGGDWITQNSMPVFIGGAELNVASALAKWKAPIAYCTALPDHHLTKEVVSFLDSKGIDTSKIQYRGHRIGTFYLPQGADLKSAGTIYDRAYSSFWELKPGEVDWDRLLQDVSWLHFTAISPALNENVAAVCLEAAKKASERGITVSVDLNYRAKLWKWGKEPLEVMPELAAQCDVVMGNIWAAGLMLGTAVDEAIHENATTEKYLAHARQTSEEVSERFPRCKVVANTFRMDGGGEGIRYFTSLYTDRRFFQSREYACETVVDRAGSGDCFMAGLIYGTTNQLPPQEIVDYATAAAFGKLQEKGDTTNQDVQSVYQTIKTGSVQKAATL